jgi:hypothetical protein
MKAGPALKLGSDQLDTGWVTKIVKQGEKFQKQAFEKGTSGTLTYRKPRNRRCSS